MISSVYKRGFKTISPFKRSSLPFSPIHQPNINFVNKKRLFSTKKKDVNINTPENNLISQLEIVEEQYQKMSPIKHILLRPDTYVGSIQPTTQNLYIYNQETNKMERKMVN